MRLPDIRLPIKKLSRQIKWMMQECGAGEGIHVLAHRYTMRLLNARRYYGVEKKRRAEENARYSSWILSQLPDEQERAQQAETVFTHQVTFVIPTFNTRPALLAALAASLMGQTNGSWQVCIYDGASDNPETLDMLKKLPERDARFHVFFGEENMGISGNTNAALAQVETDYTAFCDHDDVLAPDAVYYLLKAAEEGAELIYSDEDKVDAKGTTYFDPHMKGGYAPDTLRSGNYFCHLMAAKTALIRDIKGLRSVCDGSQDHDLALRLAMQTDKITHIPRVLYHWRMLESSASHAGTERCVNASLTAVQYQLEVLGWKAQVFRDMMKPRIRYQIDKGTKVTLLFTGSKAQLAILKRRTDWHFHEVLLVKRDRLLQVAQQASGDYLVIASPWLMPENKAWVQEMLMYAQRPDVACVGAPLTRWGGTYVHAGYAVDVPGGALSYHRDSLRWGTPYQLSDRVVRNVTGVSSHWMMIRREVFLQLGGLGAYESDLAGAALGLTALRKGYLNVLTPYALAKVVGKAPCLTGPAPQADIDQMVQEGPIEERYYPPLFEKKLGSMCIDFPDEGVQEGEAS